MSQGWQLRRGKPEDAPAIVAVVQAEEVALRGHSDFTRELLEQLVFADSTFDIAADQAIVEHDGRVIAAGSVVRRTAFVSILPDFEDAALRVQLLDWAEARQRELGRELRVGTDTLHTEQVQLLEDRGYAFERFYALMVRRFADTGPPEPAEVAAGYRVRAIDPDSDGPTLHALAERAFAGRPDHEPETLEDFTNTMLSYDAFAPAWSFIAETDDAAPAGLALSWRPSDHPHGYVALLGVDPDHQRRGLARALLLSAFGVMFAAEQPSAELHVASDNPRALDLYTGVGMIETERTEHYIRPA